MFELEASRYAKTNPRLAGAFKRQARLCFRAIERWITEPVSPLGIKNNFPTDLKHGYDPYRHNRSDAHFVAALLSLAAEFSNDSISEAPVPAEMGSYVTNLSNGFHMITATHKGLGIQINAKADLQFNATGLGRIIRIGVPIELGPGMPIGKIGSRSIITEEKWRSKKPYAIGPAWKSNGKWRSLAGLSKDVDYELRVFNETQEELNFRVTYRSGKIPGVLEEDYQITKEGIHLTCRMVPKHVDLYPDSLAINIPILITDSRDESEIVHNISDFHIKYRGATYTISSEGMEAAKLSQKQFANRHGLFIKCFR